MDIQIRESSPQALELAKTGRSSSTSMYPFDQLNVGSSFTIPLAHANHASLRTLASKKSKGTGKKFVVVLHSNQNPPCVEVARVE